MTSTLRQHLHRLPMVLALAAGLGLAGCALEEQPEPSFVGPSEFGISLSASATPDRLLRDGSSQSTVTVLARNAQGGPVANQRIALSLSGPNATALSTSEVTTGADGRATFSVTAPPSNGFGDTITVQLTPMGAESVQSLGRTVQIQVTPSNAGAPTANFAFSPAAPNVNEVVTFNATTSTDEGIPCGTTCTYTWNFGDGNSGTGMIVTKSYGTSGNKTVTLTVRDAAGADSLPFTQTVNVAPPAAPSVGAVAVSPRPVAPGALAHFDAGGATVGAGATIVDYTWVWGDGTSSETTTTAQADHRFEAEGTYTVRTTVRDSLGRTATTTTTVDVDTP